MSKFNYPETIPRNGLIAEYLLDGNANDTAGSNDGTATDITWITSERGYTKEVADFNGSSSYVDITGVSVSDVFTLNFILNRDAVTGDYEELLDTENGRMVVYLATSSKDSFQYYDGSGTIDFGYTVPIGKNLNISLNINGTEGKLYVDGILKSTKTVASRDIGGTTKIGSRYTGDLYFLDGKIGIFRIYDRILTEKEMFNIYLETKRKLGPGIMIGNNGDFSKYTPASLPKPILHINGNNDGTTFYDQSGNGNNGTQSGGIIINQVGLNKEMVFDGSDDVISLPDTQLINDINCTINFRCDINSYDDDFIFMLGDGNNYLIYLEIYSGDGKYYATMYGDGTYHQIIVPIVEGKQMITMTSDGTDFKFYVNGIELGSIGHTSHGGVSQYAKNRIGCRNYNGTDDLFYNGKISNFKVLNGKALNQKQIEALYYSNYI